MCKAIGRCAELISPAPSTSSSAQLPCMERVRVGAIGGGAFGTSLCVHCSRAGHETLIYTRNAAVMADINNPEVKENKVNFKVSTRACLLVKHDCMVRYSFWC